MFDVLERDLSSVVPPVGVEVSAEGVEGRKGEENNCWLQTFVG